MCKNCDSNCFEVIFDTCVGYTGDGVPQGSSVKDVITFLLKEIAFLKDQLKCLNETTQEPTPTVKGFDSNYSIYASKIKNTAAQYSVTPGKDSINLSFNLEGILGALPSDVKVTKHEVKVNGSGEGNTLIGNTNKNAGMFTFAPNRFPITMNYLVSLSSPAGTINLEKSVPISAGLSGDFVTSLDVKDYTAQQVGDLNLSQFAEEARERILALERKADTSRYPLVSGTEKIPIREGAALEEVLQKIITTI